MTGKFSADITRPDLFVAHRNFSDAVNANIIRSEIEGGVHLRNLMPGAVLSIRTSNREYRVVLLNNGAALISGHPEFCPEPVEVQIQGSTWGGTMIRSKYLGRGMHMEFVHPVHRRVVTSPIVEIHAY
jgi:hypothetical protein